ncbi:sensor histidine kinase [Acetobacter musti]|nr:PAS domain-containing protein [Acetobacter musti]
MTTYHLGKQNNITPGIAVETLDFLTDMICIVTTDGIYSYFNTAWRNYNDGLPDTFGSDQWLERVCEPERSRADALLSDALSSGQAGETDIRLCSDTGDSRWFMLRIHPKMDERNAVSFWFCVLTDIHERKLRENNLIRQAQIRTEMLNVSVDCIKVINDDGTLSHMNRAGCTALNVDEHSGFGMEWLGLLPQEARTPGQDALKEAAAGHNARFTGVSHLPGEEARYWDNMLTPLINPDKSVEAILCVSRDVTAQRESERRIALLLHELNHRSKNMLSVVQALVRRTIPDPDAAFVKIICQRIASIAKSQDLLIHGAWTGATMHKVAISQTAIAGDVREKRLHLTGDPELKLRPETAEKIGLAIHELTTNAIKYGALSNDCGTITIDWTTKDRTDGEFFVLRWKEAGGPEVRPPAHRGFGTTIIERNPRAVRGSSVVYTYNPDGVMWELSAPTCHVISEFS